MADNGSIYEPGFRVTKERKHHFEAEGKKGGFKILKSSLSKDKIAGFQALCKGGPVKKMAAGGAAKPETHFHLLGETPSHFHVGTRAGHSLVISKAAIDPTIHNQLRALPKIRGFADGGDTGEPNYTPANYTPATGQQTVNYTQPGDFTPVPAQTPVVASGPTSPTPAALVAENQAVYRAAAQHQAQQAQMAASPAAMASAVQSAQALEAKAASVAVAQPALARSLLETAQATRNQPVQATWDATARAQEWNLKADAIGKPPAPFNPAGQRPPSEYDWSRKVGPTPPEQAGATGVNPASQAGAMRAGMAPPPPLARPATAAAPPQDMGIPPPVAPPLAPSHAPAQAAPPTVPAAAPDPNAPGPWAGQYNKPYAPPLPPPPPPGGPGGPPRPAGYDPAAEIRQAGAAEQRAIEEQGRQEQAGYGKIASAQDLLASGLQQKTDAIMQQYKDNVARGESLFQEWRQSVAAAGQQNLNFNRFFADKSTGQKILGAIGVALGGLGSGFTGQANQALGILNGAIQRDVEQQRAQLAQKQWVAGQNEGMLNYFMRKTNDDLSAGILTIATYKDVAAAQIQAASDRLLSGVAKSRAETLAQQVRMQAAQGYQEAQQRQIQIAMERMQYEYYQSFMGQGAGGGGRENVEYLPGSAEPPMFNPMLGMKWDEYRKDLNERMVDFPELSDPATGKQVRAWAHDGEEARQIKRADNTFAELERNVNILNNLGRQHGVQIHLWGSGPRALYEQTVNDMVTKINQLQQLNRLNPQEYGAFSGMLPEEKEWFTPAGQAKINGFLSKLRFHRMELFTRYLGVPMNYLPGGMQGQSQARLPERRIQ